MHKPGHLRDAFCELIESGETAVVFFDRDKQSRFENMDTEARIYWLSGQLWNCTDVLPGGVCADLEIPQGSSYAQAARFIRQG